MINDFEQRLAFVLGSRLTGSLAGKVFVPPAPAEGPDPSLVVGVSALRALEPAFLTRKPEVVPGSPNPRRILRLECDISVEARAGQNKGRDSKVRALDAALFELGADDFQSGAALTDATDRGFFIQQMHISQGNLPLDPTVPDASPIAITLQAQGFFWPIGQVGQTGPAIEHIQLRGVAMDVDVEIPAAQMVAGGSVVNGTLRVRMPGSTEISGTGAVPLPFGSLALTLFPGKGSLGGGAAGTTGKIRIVPLVSETATFTYTPPAQAAVEDLVVAFDNHEGGLAEEIGRIPLRVRGV